MTNYEEKRQSLQAKFDKEIAELAQEEKIFNLLPLEPKRIHITGTFGAWISYEATNLEEALSIIERFDIMTAYMLKGTFTTINPRELIKAKDWEAAREEWAFVAPYVDLEKMKGYNTRANIRFFTQIEGQIMRISIEVQRNPWQIASDVQYMRGEPIKATHTPPQALTYDERIKWASGSLDSAHFTFLYGDIHNFNAVMSNFIK
jgi:hypothetical protein